MGIRRKPKSQKQSHIFFLLMAMAAIQQPYHAVEIQEGRSLLGPGLKVCSRIFCGGRGEGLQ